MKVDNRMNQTLSVNSIILTKSGELGDMNTISQMINRESIIKVFINDQGDINSKNEVRSGFVIPLVWMDSFVQNNHSWK